MPKHLGSMTSLSARYAEASLPPVRASFISLSMPLLAVCLFESCIPGLSAANLLIQGGTLIDGTGKAPITNASILVVGNTISKVWTGDRAENVPPGTQV